MNTNEKIFQAFNPKCNEVKEENEYKPKLRIQSSVYPSEDTIFLSKFQERQWHPIITAVNNADRRRTFDHFDEELLNRILDIKNQMI